MTGGALPSFRTAVGADGMPPGWPFGAGTGEGWWPMLAKGLLVLAVLVCLALTLRFLFGPGGAWRDEGDEPGRARRDNAGRRTSRK